jgi:hypothetical protein
MISKCLRPASDHYTGRIVAVSQRMVLLRPLSPAMPEHSSVGEGTGVLTVVLVIRIRVVLLILVILLLPRGVLVRKRHVVRAYEIGNGDG